MQPIRSDHNVLQVYMRGSHHLADLLSPRDGGQPAKIRQAPDNHVIFCWPFPKKEKKGNKEEQIEERHEATMTTYFSGPSVCVKAVSTIHLSQLIRTVATLKSLPWMLIVHCFIPDSKDKCDAEDGPEEDYPARDPLRKKTILSRRVIQLRETAVGFKSS